MSDRLPDAVRDIERRVAGSFAIEGVEYCVIPKTALRWALDALTPEQREPSPFVSIRPDMRFGNPSINGTRLPVDTLAEAAWEGLEPSEIEQQWDVRRADILVACWYVGRYGSRRWVKRWGEWSERVAPVLWESSTVDYAAVPWPPTSGQAEQPSGRGA